MGGVKSKVAANVCRAARAMAIKSDGSDNLLCRIVKLCGLKSDRCKTKTKEQHQQQQKQRQQRPLRRLLCWRAQQSWAWLWLHLSQQPIRSMMLADGVLKKNNAL